MYITKEERRKIDELNSHLESIGIPKEFKSWMQSYEYELGLKKGKVCHCTYCDNDFTTDLKINQYGVCPNCNKRLLIKRFDVTYIYDKQYLHLLNKYGDKYVVRQFELLQHYYKQMGKIAHNYLEIARQVFDSNGSIENSYIINTMYKNTSGYYYIRYYEDIAHWKPVKNSYYYQYDYNAFYGQFYPYNLDEEFNLKYYSLSELVGERDINICDIIAAVYSNNYPFEMLIKAQLYNLALRYFEFKNGPFEKVFGIDKSYLTFMQEHDITYDQLEILKVIKTKDYGLLKYLSQFDSYELKNLFEYCKPNDLYKYNLKSTNYRIYLDYIDFAKKLGFNINDKKYLYPKNLKEKHDEYMHQVEINKNKKVNNAIKKRYKQILKNQYQNTKYIIMPADSIESLMDESKQQDNCVKTYAERIARGECDIYFMRLVKDIKTSLVTVEVRDNHVVQQRIKYNATTTNAQKNFLKKWEKEVLLNGR